MEAKLTVVGGKASKKTIALNPPTKIGRGRSADLTVPHPMISRQHCEVIEVNGLLMIRDLGSLNGTLIGGRRIKEAALPPEAEFTIGPLTFRAEYQYEGDLNKLPEPIWAEEEDTSPSAAAKLGVKAKAPAPEPATDDQPVKAATGVGKPKPSAEHPESPSGAFDDFLEELG
jgi:pSer/pThr/pTyr-binding forkhead associated (FHA) protein